LRLLAPIDDRDPSWFALRLALWPEASKSAHLEQMKVAAARGMYVRVATANEGFAIGLVEASKREEARGGANNGTVVYFEGLYVSRKVTRLTVTRRLVDAVASWAAAEGCAQPAFDSQFEPDAAQMLHRELGFQETASGTYSRKAAIENTF